MTRWAAAGAGTNPSRAERYRLAEEALWAHHGLRPTTRFVQLADPPMRLRVLEVGSGRPVLLVHGTVGPGSWASLIEALGDARYLVLDRPGWGGSDALDFRRRPYRALAATILRGVLDALDIERAVVVGGSIGAVWALSLAERHPSRVERVVLLGAGPIVEDARRPSFIRLIASRLGALVVRLPVDGRRTRSILRGSGHGPSLDAGRIPDAFIDWRVALSNETPAMRHERDMIRAIVRGSGWQPGFLFDDADLRAIATPTLIVYGTADAVGDVDAWRRVAGTMPRGELAVVAGAGHMPWFDEPRLVADRAERFLAGGSVTQPTGRSRSGGPM